MVTAGSSRLPGISCFVHLFDDCALQVKSAADYVRDANEDITHAISSQKKVRKRQCCMIILVLIIIAIIVIVVVVLGNSGMWNMALSPACFVCCEIRISRTESDADLAAVLLEATVSPSLFGAQWHIFIRAVAVHESIKYDHFTLASWRIIHSTWYGKLFPGVR